MFNSTYRASNKAYLEKLREENSIQRTLDSIKSKKLQNETNKRRRIASAKARAQEEAEEKRRQAILAQRRAELEEATARFQRGHRTYKLLQQRRHISTEKLCSPPQLEEALRAIGTSPRNHNTNNTETISQVKLASNSFRNTRNSKSLFEQQLEKHQQILQKQQHEQLVKFNSAIWKEINGDSKVCGVEDIEIDNKEDLNSSNSSLTSIDSLERPTSSLAVKHSSLLNSTNVAVVTPNNHTTPPQSQDDDNFQQLEQHSPTYRRVVKELTFANSDEIKKESQTESLNVQHKDISTNSPLTAIQNSNKINTAESIVNDRPQDIQVCVAEVKTKSNSEVVHLKHEEQSKSLGENQNSKTSQPSLQSYPPNKYGARPLPQPPPCSEPPNNSPVEDKEDVDSVAEEIYPTTKRRVQSATIRQAKEEAVDPPLKGILKKRPVQSAPLGKRGNTRGSTVKDSLEIIRGRGIDNLEYKHNKRNVHFATILCEEAEFNEHLSTITRLTGSNSTSIVDKENNNVQFSGSQHRNQDNYLIANSSNNNDENSGNRTGKNRSNNDQNTHNGTRIPKSTNTALKPKPPQGPPPASTIRRRIISANSAIPSSTNNHEVHKHSKPTRVQSAPPRTSVQGLYKTNKLERTPTDDEINWLWDRVRTCLQQKPEEAPRVSQRIVDGSSLMKAGTVQRISSAKNPLQTQSTINRRKVNMEMLSAYSRKQPGGNIIVQERPNQFVPKCTSNVSESMAGFLAAEALTEQHHSVTESQLENALEQAKRHQFIHNQQRGTTPTSLSVEEQKLRQSLERLDEKLKNYTNVIDGSVKITSFAPRQQQVYPRPIAFE